MLVEINLLPKKEPKSTALMATIIITSLLALVLVGLFYWQYTSKTAELKTTVDRLALTQKIAETERAKLNNYESSPSVNELEQAILWAESQKIDKVFLIQEITKILPERGFVQEMDIEEDRKINLIIQFDTKSDSSYYLSSLLELEWVEEAILTDSKSTDILEGKISEEIDTSIQILKDGNFEPRYYASYEMIWNDTKLKAATKENEEGEESP